jgi:hypothetical protein
MDVHVDPSSHPQYLDKEYDTKESFLAACIKHNVSVGKECKVKPSNTHEIRVLCSDDSCDVRMMGDLSQHFLFLFSFLPVMTVLCVVSVQEEAGEMESDIP